MFRDSERQQLLTALASIRQHGNVDNVPGTRNQKLALTTVACRRRFIIWRGPAVRYQLTRRGELFLEKHTGILASFSNLKFVLATRIAMAGLMMAGIGVASSDWIERDNQDHLRVADPGSAAAARATAGSVGVAPTRVSTDSPGAETMPVRSPVDHRPGTPEQAASSLPTRVESPAPSGEPPLSKAGHNRHQRDRARHVQQKQPAKVELNGRGATPDPTWGNVGYGWNPYPFGPWSPRW